MRIGQLIFLIISFFGSIGVGECDSLSYKEFSNDAVKFVTIIRYNNHPIGTGFFYTGKFWTYLITAKHVLTGNSKSDKIALDNITCLIHGKISNSDEATSGTALINLNSAKVYDDILVSTRDVVAIKLSHSTSKGLVSANYVSILRSNGLNRGSLVTARLDDLMKFKDVNLLSDAIIFGFPSSLNMIGQFDPDWPLCKKGIIAGKNMINNTLIIDGAIFHGNSGGPVFVIDTISNKAKLIGLATQYIPYETDMPTSTPTVIANSGYSVIEPIDSLIDLMNVYDK